MATIVTHVSPDLDAVTSAWLLQRYGGLARAAVTFVNTGAPDPDVLARAAAVVDTGRVYDPGRLRFDHHQTASLPSATQLVYDWLVENGADVAHLGPLVALVDANDRGLPHPGGETSSLLGIHALVSAEKHHGAPDHDVLAWGYALLDRLDDHLRRHAEARAQVEACLRWQSPDGRVVALDTTGAASGPAVTRAAGEVLGCELVVWESRERAADGRTTYSVGCMRIGESTTDVGALVGRVGCDPDSEMARELDSWFRHPSGFFAGRGTLKAPRYDAPQVSAASIARVLWSELALREH